MRRLLPFAAALLALSACALVAGIDEHHLSPDDPGAPDSADSAAFDGGVDASDSAEATDAASDVKIDGGPILFRQNAHGEATSTDVAVVPLPLPVAAHDTIIVALNSETPAGGAAAPVLTDGANTYVKALDFDVVAGPWSVYVFVASDVAPGSVTLNVQFPEARNGIEVYVHVYSGISGVVSDSATSVWTSCDSTVDCVTTRPLNVPPGRSLLFSYAISGTVVAGTGFTPRDNFNNNISQERIVDGPGQYPATATKVSGPVAGILGAVFPAR